MTQQRISSDDDFPIVVGLVIILLITYAVSLMFK